MLGELGDAGKLDQADFVIRNQVGAANVEILAAATGQIFELPA
jgi:hypothetical protein